LMMPFVRRNMLTASTAFTALTVLRRVAVVACTGLLGLGACTTPAPATRPVLSNERIAALISSPDRSEADRTNDQRRKPAQLLAFIGVWPGIVALDVVAGGGYTSELLARAAGPTGRVYAQSAPRVQRPPPAQPEGAASPVSPAAAASAPATPPRTSAMAVAARAASANLNQLSAVVQPFDAPVPPEAATNTLDLVTLMFNYHDLGHIGTDRDKMNQAIFAALKPGGVYVIADHAGRPGTGISEAGTLHRIEEAFLRAEVERAGFKWQASADFLRNPNDPRDKNTPEPPMPKDDFVLKFVKP
jgi:predicted methyltransferase